MAGCLQCEDQVDECHTVVEVTLLYFALLEHVDTTPLLVEAQGNETILELNTKLN